MGRPEMEEKNATDSVKKDRAVSSSSEKKDLSTSSPGKSEGVPAETMDPLSASPEKSEKIPAGSESSERRGRSFASPIKWESSPSKRCRFDDKRKAVVVESDEGTKPAAMIGGVRIVIDILAQLLGGGITWEDFDPYGKVENPMTQVDPKTPVVGDMASPFSESFVEIASTPDSSCMFPNLT